MCLANLSDNALVQFAGFGERLGRLIRYHQSINLCGRIVKSRLRRVYLESSNSQGIP